MSDESVWRTLLAGMGVVGLAWHIALALSYMVYRYRCDAHRIKHLEAMDPDDVVTRINDLGFVDGALTNFDSLARWTVGVPMLATCVGLNLGEWWSPVDDLRGLLGLIGRSMIVLLVIPLIGNILALANYESLYTVWYQRELYLSPLEWHSARKVSAARFNGKVWRAECGSSRTRV